MKNPFTFFGVTAVLAFSGIAWMSGCNKNQSAPNAPPPAAAVPPQSSTPLAVLAPATEKDVLGVWQATKVVDDKGQTKTGGIYEDILSSRLEIRPDHTYGTTNTAMGHWFGTWTLKGNTLTLTPALPRRANSDSIAVELPRLVESDKSDPYSLATVYEKQGPAPADDSPKFKLTADQFQNEVKTNFAAAQAKYNNQRVEITGVVTDLTFDSLQVSLSVAGPAASDPTDSRLSGGVNCISLDPEPWSTIGYYQPVKVNGVAILMKDWAVISEAKFTLVGPPVLISITAEDLAAQYAKDPGGTQKKYTVGYSSQSFLVTGVVLEKQIKQGTFSTLVLGKPGASVRCEYSNGGADVAKILAPIQVGQTIKIAGQMNVNSSGNIPELDECNLITR